jgi:hypothetical protein
MTQSEYERRRRLLEEQLQAALDMVRSGYEIAFRALEELREERAAGERNGAKAAAGTTRPASAQPRHSRLPINQWQDDLESALPTLPEVFTKADLVRALGYQPARGTLLRIFDKLLLERRITVVKASDGGKPTTYRKVPTP